MLCTQATLKKTSANGKLITAEPLYCRSWSCEICNPRRRQRLVREVNHGEPSTLITLTVNPHWYDSRGERARKLVAAWREARRQICRRYGYKSFPFMAVFEKTKRGEPHLHIAARIKWVDQKVLSDIMGRLIGAPVVDIRHVDNPGRAAKYLAKYLGKDPSVFEGCKRYWRSQDWLKTRTHDEWLAMLPNDTVEVVKEDWYEFSVKVLGRLGRVQIDEKRLVALCFLDVP